MHLRNRVGLVFLLLMLAPSAVSQQPIANAALTAVRDVPLPGPAVRFDYQSLDAQHGRLYIAHMNADQIVVFDVRSSKVVASLDGFSRVHGVLAVPEIDRVFASATGKHTVQAVDMRSLRTVGSAGTIDYPDGIAYAPSVARVFVSDEHGNSDAAVDARSMRLLKSIPLPGGAGNTVYDPGSGQILVGVHGANELVAIDPDAMKIVARWHLAGVENPHGIVLDQSNRLAFVAGEENHSLTVFDLRGHTQLSTYQVGDDPDVLAFDPVLKRLYVSAESGTVCVFQEIGRRLRLLSRFDMPHAHTVAVDPQTHLVYFPLQDAGGRPILRIMRPTAVALPLDHSH